MLKKFVSSILILLLLIGCNNNKINIIDKANELITELNLKDVVVEIESNSIEDFFYLDDGTLEYGIFYISNINTSDMVGIFKAKNNDELENNIKEYLENVKVKNINYFPKEVEKLNNAIIKEKSGYVYLIVSNDQNKALDIINK